MIINNGNSIEIGHPPKSKHFRHKSWLKSYSFVLIHVANIVLYSENHGKDGGRLPGAGNCVGLIWIFDCLVASSHRHLQPSHRHVPFITGSSGLTRWDHSQFTLVDSHSSSCCDLTSLLLKHLFSRPKAQTGTSQEEDYPPPPEHPAHCSRCRSLEALGAFCRPSAAAAGQRCGRPSEASGDADCTTFSAMRRMVRSRFPARALAGAGPGGQGVTWQ